MGWPIVVCTDHAALTYHENARAHRLPEPIGQQRTWLDLCRDDPVSVMGIRTFSSDRGQPGHLLQHRSLVPQLQWMYSHHHWCRSTTRHPTRKLTSLLTYLGRDRQTCICSSRRTQTQISRSRQTLHLTSWTCQYPQFPRIK